MYLSIYIYIYICVCIYIYIYIYIYKSARSRGACCIALSHGRAEPNCVTAQVGSFGVCRAAARRDLWSREGSGASACSGSGKARSHGGTR